MPTVSIPLVHFPANAMRISPVMAVHVHVSIPLSMYVLSKFKAVSQFSSSSFCTCLIAVIECRTPAAPQFGNVTTSESQLVLNSTVQFDCQEGFQLNGTSVLTCTDNGTLSDIVPVCDGKHMNNC